MHRDFLFPYFPMHFSMYFCLCLWLLCIGISIFPIFLCISLRLRLLLCIGISYFPIFLCIFLRLRLLTHIRTNSAHNPIRKSPQHTKSPQKKRETKVSRPFQQTFLFNKALHQATHCLTALHQATHCTTALRQATHCATILHKVLYAAFEDLEILLAVDIDCN